ncbi:glycine--tRNA ligase subunit beta [Marinilactibacillus psychrotolerans]|uniref:glycine--tRNA ligase subunit beta n=1 Tax=Marinilactibacillus psychrotolerans TaxID=191770 RepID=UPI003889C155
MNHTFLLEIGLEEMPAKIIDPSVEQLKNNVESFLNEANLSFESIKLFSTPRRLALMIEGLAEVQPDDVQMVKGPAKKIAQDAEGNWSKAAIGFTKGQGASTDDIVFKEVKGVEYIFVEKFTKGKKAVEVLPGITTCITSMNFPVSMKWHTHSYRFIRPIHWIVAMLDQAVVPFEVFNVHSGSITQGHRFLGKEVQLTHASEYEHILEKQNVIADREKRKSTIVNQITDLCQEKGWKVPLDNKELLNEVTDLVEYPTAFFGSFNEDYLQVPEAALEVSMADHQRYFPVRKQDDTQVFLPYFIAVRNGSEDQIDTVIKGNEKVLAARLADAKFFYQEDQKISIEACVDKLKRVSFHEKLGSLYDKQERVSVIAQILANEFDLSKQEKDALNRASEIFKFDLVTNTVIEFTKLQGKIGAILAKEKGEKELVGDAISEQYLPSSATSELPSTKVGTVLSLADKLDTLIMFFAIGQVPTGSNDPFALRRQAMGIVRMIENSGRHFSLKNLMNQIEEALNINVELKAGVAQNQNLVLQFIKDRIDQQMQLSNESGGIPFDIRQAVLKADQDDIVFTFDAALTLNKNKDTADYKATIEALTRVSNLADKASEEILVSEELFEKDSEKNLYLAVKQTKNIFSHTIDANKRYQALKELSPTIDIFFEENMVMADDEKIKNNRLAMLKSIKHLLITFADLSQLLIK